MYLSCFPSLWPNIFTLNTTFMWGLVWRLVAGWVERWMYDAHAYNIYAEQNGVLCCFMSIIYIPFFENEK